MDIKTLLKGKLKIARKLKGLTQEKTAELIGIEYSYYRALENGYATPSVNVLMKLTEVLEITLDDMVTKDEKSETYHLIIGLLSKCNEKDLNIVLSTVNAILENKN